MLFLLNTIEEKSSWTSSILQWWYISSLTSGPISAKLCTKIPIHRAILSIFLNILKYVLYAVILNFFVINKLVFKDQLALEAAGPLEPLLKGRAFNDRQGDIPNRAPNGCISWQHEFKIWEELWCIPLARYHWCMSLLKIIQIMPNQFRQRVISTLHGGDGEKIYPFIQGVSH